MTTTEKVRDYIREGQRSYEEYRDRFMADPENRRISEEEAAKKELWLQLVEARQEAGLTQAELAKRLGFHRRRWPALKSVATTPTR